MPEYVIFPLLSSKSCMALIPLGVAALPRPSRFELMLIAIYLFASSFLLLKRMRMIGERSLDNFSPRPLLSTMLIMPSQTAYMLARLIHSWKLFAEDSKKIPTIEPGFEKISIKHEEIISIGQIVLI